MAGGIDSVLVHKHAKKKELGQYLAILTEQDWSITQLFAFIIIVMGFSVKLRSFKKGAVIYLYFVNEVREFTAYWSCTIIWTIDIKFEVAPRTHTIVCLSIDLVIVARIFTRPTFAIELNSKAFVILEMKNKKLNTEESRAESKAPSRNFTIFRLF